MRIISKKAKVVYDYSNDILVARDIKRKYDFSEQIGNFIIDADKDNKIIGFELLHASEVFGVPKLILQNAHALLLEIFIQEGIVAFKTRIESKIRNGLRVCSVNIERLRPKNMKESELRIELNA